MILTSDFENWEEKGENQTLEAAFPAGAVNMQKAESSKGKWKENGKLRTPRTLVDNGLRQNGS
jgi:hypothetical protein